MPETPTEVGEATTLSEDLWREHDRLKGAMLDAVDPTTFKTIVQLFKAAKICRHKIQQISRSTLIDEAH